MGADGGWRFGYTPGDSRYSGQIFLRYSLEKNVRGLGKQGAGQDSHITRT